jgi:uncharacterized membrane protein
MVVAFGCSWPVNVAKSWRMRTTTGKSLAFLVLIFVGYLLGITGKILAPSCKWYVLFFYILNSVMVGVDLLLYARNWRLDRQKNQ